MDKDLQATHHKHVPWNTWHGYCKSCNKIIHVAFGGRLCPRCGDRVLDYLGHLSDLEKRIMQLEINENGSLSTFWFKDR